eukprot:3635804-Amphidinium_carterae.1
MDYTFATEGPATMTILTMRFRSTGWSSATPVPSKGACAYAVDWAIAVLRSVGSQPCRILTDAEDSIKALANAVVDKMANGSIVRQAPRSSHQSVGAVERYHAELHGHIRAMKTELEQKLSKKVELQNPLYAWLVKHVSWLIPRFSKYGDMTPYQRLYGIACDTAVVHFAELVLAHEPEAGHQAKHKERAYRGWWLGRSEISGEHLVAVADTGAVLRFRTVRRMNALEQMDMN